MDTVKPEPVFPPGLERLIEEKWGPAEAWGSPGEWQAFVGERVGLRTPHLEILADLVAERLPLTGRRVLDIGCGEGGLAKNLEARGASAVGLDLDSQNLVIARAARLHNGLVPGAFVSGTGTRLPFRDGSFDLVAAVETIEHVGRPAVLVEEMFRVVRPRGHVLVTTPNLLQPYEPHARLLGVHWVPRFVRGGLTKALGETSALSERLRALDSLHYFTRESLRALLDGHANATLDLGEAWLRHSLRRQKTGVATSDPWSARVLNLLLGVGAPRWPQVASRVLLRFMPLKFLCQKGGSVP